jgi:HK97 gp10 family phage protein
MAGRVYFKFELSGTQELLEAFDELPKAVGQQVLTDICNRAAQPIVQAAKALAPDDPDHPGSLKDSIGVRKWKGRKWTGVVIGPKWPEGAHGHLLELGTGPRYHKTTGKYVGIGPAKPFMRPAWDANKGAALDIMRNEVWDALAKAAAKLRKKAEKGTLGKSARRALGGF